MLLSAAVAATGAPLPGDQPAAEAVQALPGLHRLAPIVNGLGGFQWAVLLAAAILAGLARWRRPLVPPVALLAVLPLAIPLLFADNVLKVIIRSPRPEASSGLRITEFQTSFGFPSGHVFGDVLVVGLLAWVCWHSLPRRAGLAGLAAATVVLALAGPSRVAVGAHWPSDILGGYLWGAAALAGLLLAAERIPPWWARRVG